MFLIFGLWMPELLIFELNIGFLVKNCICCQLETSRILKLYPDIENISFNILRFKTTKSGYFGLIMATFKDMNWASMM